MMRRFYPQRVVGSSIEGLYEIVDSVENAVVSEPMTWLDARDEADRRNKPKSADAELAPAGPMTWSI